MSVLLSPKNEELATNSVKALLKHLEKEENEELIYLIVNTEKPLIRQSDHTARIIIIPNKFGKIRKKSILLVTKDPAKTFRDILEAKDSRTEDLFKDIIGLKKLKSKTSNSTNSKKLDKDYDIIMSDVKVHHKLYSILGSRFYHKNRKVPFMLEFHEPCDPDHVYRQVKTILRNTYFVCPDKGTTLSIQIGTSQMEYQQVLGNAEAVLEYLTNPRHVPSGGLIRPGYNKLKSVHVKSSNSSSMPMLSSTPAASPESENY